MPQNSFALQTKNISSNSFPILPQNLLVLHLSPDVLNFSRCHFLPNPSTPARRCCFPRCFARALSLVGSEVESDGGERESRGGR
jgi:hypothetical protein